MIHKLKKGKFDSSTFSIGVHAFKTKQKIRVKFSKECLYKPLDFENDYNKLYGWSYGLHHKNSIRVCWRPYVPPGAHWEFFNPNKIELCIYVYEDGVRKISEHTLVIDVERFYDFTLDYEPEMNGRISLWYFDVMHVGITTVYTTKPCIGYELFPYFGGSDPAPNDMDIELDKL